MNHVGILIQILINGSHTEAYQFTGIIKALTEFLGNKIGHIRDVLLLLTGIRRIS